MTFTSIPRFFFLVPELALTIILTIILFLEEVPLASPFILPMVQMFHVSLELTPPYSLFSDKDYSTMEPEEKYKWIEYHKWKVNATFYTEIFPKAVIMTRAKLGFLGHYNARISVLRLLRGFTWVVTVFQVTTTLMAVRL